MAVRRSGGAVALCSFTTTIGYGSLLFADNQALQSFGHLAMSGEILALLAAMLVLPAILHLWPQKKAHLALTPAKTAHASEEKPPVVKRENAE